MIGELMFIWFSGSVINMFHIIVTWPSIIFVILLLLQDSFFNKNPKEAPLERRLVSMLFIMDLKSRFQNIQCAAYNLAATRWRLFLYFLFSSTEV